MNTNFIFALLILTLFSCESKDRDFSFVFQESIMEPTIRKGEIVTFSNDLQDLNIGDIIAYDPPHVDGGTLIGRVAGLNGDVISYSEEWLAINNSLYNYTQVNHIELYPESPPIPSSSSSELRITPDSTLEIKTDEVFIVADRWTGAIDSRHFGVISTSRIFGVAK